MNIVDDVTVQEVAAAFALVVIPTYLFVFGLDSVELWASAILACIIIAESIVFTGQMRRRVPNAMRALPSWWGVFRTLYAPLSVFTVVALLWHSSVPPGAGHWLALLVIAAGLASPPCVMMASERVAVSRVLASLLPWAGTWAVALLAATGLLRPPLAALGIAFGFALIATPVWRAAAPDLLSAPRSAAV